MPVNIGRPWAFCGDEPIAQSEFLHQLYGRGFLNKKRVWASVDGEFVYRFGPDHPAETVGLFK